MCVKDLEQVGEEMGNLGKDNNNNSDEENDQRALHCEAERKFVAKSDRVSIYKGVYYAYFCIFLMTHLAKTAILFCSIVICFILHFSLQRSC